MKKKALSLFIVLAMLLSMIPLSPMTVFSAVEGDWLYTLYDGDTTVSITGYTGSDADIVIPSIIDGKPVTRIGTDAFKDNTIIRTVVIPDSILRIENTAFVNTLITSVDFGEGVTYIGQSAFNGTALTSITIPDSVETIDTSAFALCTNLSTVTIEGNNLTTLGGGAFVGTAITSFRIPTSLTTIKEWTFSDCASLESIQIPSNITSIEYYAFGNNASLTSATFAGDAPVMGNYVFSSANEAFVIYYNNGASNFTTPTWTTGLETYNTIELGASDTESPIISGQSIWRSSASTANVRFMSSEAGIYYYKIADNDTVPSTVDLSEWTTGAAIAVDTTVTFSPSGLTAGEQYVHIVVEDSSGNVSDPLSIAMPYNYYYFENFETYPLDTYIASNAMSPLAQRNAGSGSTAQKVILAGSEKTLSLTSNYLSASDQHVLLSSSTLASSDTYVFEGDVYPLLDSGFQLRFSFTDGSYEGSHEAGVFFNGGKITTATKSGSVTLKDSYTANEWHHVKIVSDPTEGKYAVYVDNELLSDTLSLPSGINRLALSAGNLANNTTAYYDNLTFYAIPAPVVLDVAAGNIVIKANSYDSGASTNIENSSNSYIITQSNPDTATSNTITIQENVDASIAIDGINIDTNTCAFGVSAGSKVTLDLSGANYLKSGADRAGLEVPVGAELVVTGTNTDTLNVIGGDYAAGIGGGRGSSGGTITIGGGGITSIGGNAAGGTGSGAGIGGGRGGSGGDIIIEGGEIDATGGYRAAGIGGGTGGSSGMILIKDGIITATAVTSSYSAGIGGGYDGKADTITIEGGTIIATGHDGAGIGGGRIQNTPSTTDGGTITISGGDITTSSSMGSGIGGGLLTSITYVMPTTINITGGTIESTSSFAGIGSNQGEISISNGHITASSTADGAGIGGAYGGRINGGTINISGGTIVAQGGSNGAAGIGGGFYGNAVDSPGSTINISGGDITASGGLYSAGIGGGYGTSAGEITITGGEIVAHGGIGGSAIGIGSVGFGGTGGGGTLVISKALITASVESPQDSTAINAGPTGSIYVGFTGEPSEWVCDPIDNSAEITFQNSSFAPNGLLLGTCVIAGAGEEMDGTYIEGVKQSSISFWTDDINSDSQYPFGGGDGSSAEMAYEISSPEQLAQLAYNTNLGYGYENKYFVLTDDIDLSGKQWMPIGESQPFKGNFDGGGYSISEMVMTEDSSANIYGLFGYLSASGTIENLTIASGLINFSEAAGYGYFGGIVGYSEGLVKNCVNKANISVINNDWTYAGGIAGMGNSDIMNYVWTSRIFGCRNEGDIQIGRIGSVGGIIGSQGNSLSTTYIDQCSNSGSITGGQNAEAGGIAGRINNANTLGVINCFNTGSVTSGDGTSNSVYAGGIVGYEYYSSVKNCYNTGDVTLLYSSIGNTFCGGISGHADIAAINCFNVGNISGTGRSGEGINGSGIPSENCYYLDTSTPSTSISGMTALNDAQMKNQVSYEDWDFPNIWSINKIDNNGYPALAWQGYTHETLTADSSWINGITSAGQYPFGGGDGSSEALAYEISTTNQLAQLAYNVNNGNDYTGKYFKLMNDLDLAGKEWTPIGYRFYPGQENGFNGNFDGNNKRITSIAIGSSSEPKTGGDQTQAGLFGATRYVANIKDLHVQGSLYVHNVSNVGMLLGYSESGGTISGCSAEGTIVSTGSGDIRIGGLIGDTSGTSVIRCSSDVDINASNGSKAVGGLIGWHGAYSYDRIRPLDSCVYTGTLVSGNITGDGGVGGIAGKSYGYTIIYNSVNKGTITGSEGNIGGIVGIQHNEGIINCYSSGTVAGNGNYPSAVGGITGYIDWGKVYNCYDSGRVSSTGTALVGALVGNAPSTATIVSNGYFDGTINDDLAHVRSTSGNKYYLHEFTTEVMKGADPGSDFEYADGVYANGENAIIEALNGWIGLKQSTYPDTIFKEWNIISTLNDGYPDLTGAEEPGPSNDATLSALAASGVTLSPAFSSSVTSYSANVFNSKTSVSIAATSSNSNAVVSINGDNTLTKDVNLVVGSNTITILVTAEDTITTETYTITLNRAAASSGGGSSKPTAPPPVNVTTETTNGKTTNKTTTDTEEINGTAEADITTPMVNALLQKANETSGTDKGDLFEIDMNIDKDIDKLDVTISQSNLARIASQTDAGLALTSSFASITFDGRALETIAGANSGGDVLISASLVDKNTLSEKDKVIVKDRPVYDFSVFNSGTQVSDFSGGKATVSVPYTLQPGEDPESVVIYHLANNGSLKTVRGHYDAASGSVIFTTSHFSKFIVGYNQVSFTDVLPGSWYKNAVDFIAAREITSGTAPGIFSPDAKLTRAQFVVLLMNAYQINIQNQESTNQIQNFSDAGNTYYTNHLKAAKALGIVNGVGNNLFAPEKEITRQEMFVMLHNALKVIDEVPEVVISKDLSSFNDANQIDDWANEAFKTLVNAGIVTGSNNKLNPTHNTTRAEIAQVLYNLFTK